MAYNIKNISKQNMKALKNSQVEFHILVIKIELL